MRFQQGRYAEALILLTKAMETNPAAADVHIMQGLCLQALRKPAQALASYDRALVIQPDNGAALVNRGTILRSTGNLSEALASYDRALAIDPAFVDALANRGAVLRDLGRPQDALASFETVLSLQPSATAWFNRATALQDLRRLDEALEGYDKALAIRPDFATALFSRGTCLLTMHRQQEALASFDKALTVQPAYFDALYQRANLLRDMERLDEALEDFGKALALAPRAPNVLHGRGSVLRGLRRLPEALESYDQALLADSRRAETHLDRGNVLRDMGKPAEALETYDRAIALDPESAVAHFNRAGLLLDLGRLKEAILAYQRTLEIEPDFPYARGELFNAQLHAGDWADFKERARVIDAGVRAGKKVALPFTYQTISDTPADLQACSSIYAKTLYPGVDGVSYMPRKRTEKIRIGYVCGEFREHATGYLMAGLFERHDRDKFEIFAFDNGWNDNSPIRKRLESAFGGFITVAALSDHDSVRAIVAREIDILVDLNGYCGLGRTGVFARRPAPVQVNYLGFQGTLGTDHMDYILADRFIIPEEERQLYNERVVYLPGSYWVNDEYQSLDMTGMDRADHGLPGDAFVFCNFNQSYKISPPVFALWMRILMACPDSVLWLLETNSTFAEKIRNEAAAHGIAPDRLIFAEPIARDAHLARIGLADLFLDTLPYNAHTTAADALRAGVPLLTCRGTSFAGRVATSLLHAVGLPELVTENLEEYRALALRLAHDPSLLRALRDKLSHNRSHAALFDTDRFRRHLEAAYATMMEINRSGEKPRSFAVAET
jgi:predicted O-linked N-acetylglucosamine transferase (SPINDLY family)